ncbi:hypothetical protein Zmor_002207 [Zophobas morio]|uniref:Uncharacterized protein n=1 Tax=Zophobas morio TaxID=2755281 RepID=A0AA38J756_9CUCU|nr:hypothetical protein Zmor_002207 [Zophobas morio]
MTYERSSAGSPGLFLAKCMLKKVMNVQRQIEKSSAVIGDSPPNPGALRSHSSPRRIYSLAGPSRKLCHTSFRHEFLQVLYSGSLFVRPLVNIRVSLLRHGH